MRFIYIILLGMLIFNGMIIIFSPYFPAESLVSSGATDPSSSDSPTSQYMNITNKDTIVSIITAGGGIFVGAVVLAVVTKNIVWIGAGAFVAFIVGLWAGISNPITGILSYFSHSGVSLYSLFLICLGIVITASVIEMFVQQRGAG